jgi:hypothetical protein
VSKKLEKNGMWESSRMMLPEHREQILKSNRALIKKEKPELHTEELEIIAQHIRQSLLTKEEVIILLFGEYTDRSVTGIVNHVDQHKRLVRVERNNEFEWLKLDEVLKVSIC